MVLTMLQGSSKENQWQRMEKKPSTIMRLINPSLIKRKNMTGTML